MSAVRQSQTNTGLYTAIAMACLFIISVVFAIIFYVKYEDERTLKVAAETRAKTVSASEKKISGLLDEILEKVTGETSDADSEAKLNKAKIEVNETMTALGSDATGLYGEEGFDLLQTIISLKGKLDEARNVASEYQARIKEIQEDFDITIREYDEAAKQINAEKDKYMAKQDETLRQFNELKEQMKLSTDEQIQAWAKKVEVSEERLKQQNIELLRTQSTLDETRGQLKEALDKLASINPAPDNDVLAFEPDGRIFNADLQSGLIYLDIGQKDHVYVGLTFKVFEKNAPMPEDGKGKAEIEVFRVSENASVARIIASSPKNPIVAGDIAVNMIWDSARSNIFMIIGEFDFDGDENVDRDGRKKIEQLITQWDGRVVEELTINTDFLIVGTPPKEMTKPTRDQMDLNPELEQKYNDSLKASEAYNQVIEKANTLSVPIFNRTKFLRLIGYKTQAEKSKSF